MSDNKLIFSVRLILTNQNKILLLAQTTANGGKYAFIGGKLAKKELAKKALIRESFEETGIQLKAKNLTLVHVSNKLVAEKQLVELYFKGKNWKGDFIMKEPHKFKKVKWFPINKLPKNATKKVRFIVKQYLNKSAYSEI